MGRRPILVAATLAAGAWGCGWGEVFQAAGPGDVRFEWVGDTVVDVAVPSHFQILLLVDGVVASSPRVQIAIPDTTVIAFGSTSDSIVGSRPGSADVVAWVEHSLAPRIDTTFRIRSRP